MRHINLVQTVATAHRYAHLLSLTALFGILVGYASLAAAASDPTKPSSSCKVSETKNFSDACFVAAEADLKEGEARRFTNARAGYLGGINATCRYGQVAWSEAICTAGPRLAAPSQGGSRAALTLPAARQQYQIGTYYFGGWTDNLVGGAYPEPWAKIRLYPDRQPMLGQYADSKPSVLDQQVRWMREYGIDFVVFNWYWGHHSKPFMDHALQAYLGLPSRHGVRFAVQWSNHTEYNFSRIQFEQLFSYWARNYFKHSDYQLLDGKPVVYLFSAKVLHRNATAIGMSTRELIALADRIAKAEGLPGISVVGGMWGGDASYDYAALDGFAAYTSYNYHSPATQALRPQRPSNQSHNYAELHAAYTDQWSWMLSRTTRNFVVPITSGWDKRPWGGSTDPQHDNSRSTPEEFRIHLAAARSFMEEHSGRTYRTGVICCWNELGEGSFIEPTKFDGFKYLEQVRSVFSRDE